MNSRTIDELLNLSHTHPIIVFDGVCNLCNGFVQWLLKRDKRRIFRYATLQSESGTALYEKSATTEDTVLLVDDGKVYVLSDVGLRSMAILGGGWMIVSWLQIVPRPIRDTIYRWIARNRYRWFGKQDVCMIPDDSIQSLFV